MQSSWGPRIFWFVVFILAALGVYAFFYQPDEEGRFGYAAPQTNMVHIGSSVGSCQIEFGQPGQDPRDWTGAIKLAKGKILQLYPEHAGPTSVLSSIRFDLRPDPNQAVKRPVLLHVVYEAPPDDTLQLKVGDETQKIPLADIALGKPTLDLFAGTVRVSGQVPVQVFENDGQSEDHSPVVTRDAQGVDYLLYMNSERSKGMDVNGVLAGSFETLENPVLNTTLRLSRFHNGAWQYSEVVAPKLESCLDPVAAIDPTGRMFVAWAQKSTDGWDIYYQSKDYGTKGDTALSWSTPVKLTPKAGFVQQLVAATDSKGKVWLAWQTWYQDHCEIFAAVINDDKHFMKVPGPIAEHPKEDEGRWFPALAADTLGNMYLAWTVFRQGHFDIEVMKLHENMVKGKPVSLASSNRNAMRASLACDADNHLWVAFEESESDNSFGDFRMPASRIRVNTLRTDGKIEERSQVASPRRTAIAENSKQAPEVRSTLPRMLMSPEGPLVLFSAQHQLYVSHWKGNGWTEPSVMAHTDPAVQTNAQALFQSGHVVGVQENLDWKGRMRLQFAMAKVPAGPGTSTKATAPASASTESPAWKPFTELARQFRKRSDDLILSKRYLLRGLVIMPAVVDQFNTDPWGVACTALEQSRYDWLLIPHNLRTPVVEQWQTALRAHSLSFQEDRSMLLGYYRPLIGQREPVLLLDTKKDELPLAPLSEFENLRKNADKTSRISVNQTVDRGIITQFLTQRQHLGFTLTDDWRMLPTMTQPGSNEAYNDTIERLLLPLWHPQQTPSRPVPPALRVVTYANGKSNDYLIDSLRERHYYIATDDIYLLVHCERHLPGDVFQTSFRPAINVTVQGTGKIKNVEIWQDNKLVMNEEPPGSAAILEYKNETTDRQWHSYTVKVIQENGAEAIAQPFWIRYIP